jgi:NhaA family Na+:H+ antiporter
LFRIRKRIYEGELSNIKDALLPIFAVGGMLVPAGIYLLFNYGGVAQAGAGIPMATDIAFALGILSY